MHLRKPGVRRGKSTSTHPKRKNGSLKRPVHCVEKRSKGVVSNDTQTDSFSGQQAIVRCTLHFFQAHLACIFFHRGSATATGPSSDLYSNSSVSVSLFRRNKQSQTLVVASECVKNDRVSRGEVHSCWLTHDPSTPIPTRGIDV